MTANRRATAKFTRNSIPALFNFVGHPNKSLKLTQRAIAFLNFTLALFILDPPLAINQKFLKRVNVKQQQSPSIRPKTKLIKNSMIGIKSIMSQYYS